MATKRIKSHRELDVYQMAFKAGMRIFHLSKAFPKEEHYSLSNQVKRSSRSVCANIAEAYRKRKYPNALVVKLSDSEAEAAETQTWLDFAFECDYLSKNVKEELNEEYEKIIGKLVNMSRDPGKWRV